MLYGIEYKYILSGINVIRPLRTKQAKDIANMITNIYKVGPLTYPKVFQCDNGSEFKAGVTKVLEKHGVMIQHKTMKEQACSHGIHQGFEQVTCKNLFKVQVVQELNDPGKLSST